MRVSGIAQYLGGADNVNAISLIRGEQINYQGVVREQAEAPAVGNPIDIAAFTISAVAEFYTADVAITGSGRTATATISGFASSTKADATLTVTKATDTSTGAFTITIPQDLAVDSDTADLDATTGVLVAVIYITYNDGGNPATIRKSRVLAFIRHSG